MCISEQSVSVQECVGVYSCVTVRMCVREKENMYVREKVGGKREKVDEGMRKKEKSDENEGGSIRVGDREQKSTSTHHQVHTPALPSAISRRDMETGVRSWGWSLMACAYLRSTSIPD